MLDIFSDFFLSMTLSMNRSIKSLSPDIAYELKEK